ncbi:biotin-dependent carboxyltransferase family protein [Sphingobacterium sp. lm-10]|uniref:5-oxoprolinase subunit C family protein n=1 Tax=Sphingobacterium sp. lm-10 TaxID=2944904 RepID=UPI00202094D4|nr:biotin-dependent carboxyltransferase family protein [Sphingobacterium sp. lm-10]MCL7987530.1 biotin-dependent carboxyltransferase family protein [Sphingobacterium sp. lm-10]
MEIKLHKPGPFSTIQDLGRLDFLSSGVPKSGAMDTASARLANAALANTAGAAVIEFTYAQAEIEILSDMLLAYSGYGGNFIQDDQTLPANRPLALEKGARLRLVPDGTGCRTYLAAPGGWDVAEVMGSRSTYLPAAIGGLAGRLLQTGDVLRASTWERKHRQLFKNLLDNKRHYPQWSLKPLSLITAGTQAIRVVLGPEAHRFTSESQQRFLSSIFEIDRNSNRMGYTLEGAILQREENQEMLSTAVLPGTIQVPGNGHPILLMADCQTTGGYPRIAQVAAVDLPRCGQLKPGDRICFQEISVADAENLYLEQEDHYWKMTEAIDFNYHSS